MRRLSRLILLVFVLAVSGVLTSCATATSAPQAAATAVTAAVPAATETALPQPTLTPATPVTPTPSAANNAANAVAPQSPEQLHLELGPTELKIMTFNIWIGGEVVDFRRVIEAIQLSGADIVGLQEAEGNTARIAAHLGWYANERLMLISRFPLIEPPEAQSEMGVDYLYAQIAPGQVVAVTNVHLTSDPYGPYAVRDGESLEAVLELERGLRLPEIEERIASWQELLTDEMPLFVTGDFNTPSHLDWTEATVDSLPHMLYPVEWPVTRAMEEAGFADTFRAANPDPLADPGRTWTYGYPYPRLDADEAIDRIDYIFAAGDVEVLASQVLGQPGMPDVDIPIELYPSDHRAVVSTVRVDPVEPPIFVAPERIRVTAGERLVVRYHTPGGDETDRLALVPAGGAVPADELMWLPPQEAEFVGAVRFGTGGLQPGAYDVVLVGEGDQELARRSFWIVAPAALAEVSVDKPSYAAGESITLTWNNAPAHMRDWVAIYTSGAIDLYSGYWAYAYTGASVTGSYTFGPDDIGEDMLPAGEYVAVLMSDDGYAVLAQVPFTVEP